MGGARRHVDIENVEIERVAGVDRLQRGIGVGRQDDRVAVLLEMQFDQPSRAAASCFCM